MDSWKKFRTRGAFGGGKGSAKRPPASTGSRQTSNSCGREGSSKRSRDTSSSAAADSEAGGIGGGGSEATGRGIRACTDGRDREEASAEAAAAAAAQATPCPAGAAAGCNVKDDVAVAALVAAAVPDHNGDDD